MTPVKRQQSAQPRKESPTIKTLRANLIQLLAAVTLFAAVILLLLLLGACDRVLV
jgi:hypothetical protein